MGFELVEHCFENSYGKISIFLILDIRPSELYSEPDVANIAKPPVRDDYAEPVDSLQPGDNPDELVANPIYEGIYSEPLYGIAGTILVGPQVMLLMPWYSVFILLSFTD